VIKATTGQQTTSSAKGEITSANVGQLQLDWKADLGGAAAGHYKEGVYAPIVSGDRVFEATTPGAIYSYPVDCASDGASCQGTLFAQTEGSIGQPLVLADGTIYVTTGAGKLYAFPADCPAPCSPSWVGSTVTGPRAIDCGPRKPPNCFPASEFIAPPLVSDGMVLGDTSEGTFYAFPTDCDAGQGTTIGAVCEPAWTARLNGTPYAPVAFEGVVYASNGWDRIYAFDVHTGRKLWIAEPTRPVSHHGLLLAIQGGVIATTFGTDTLDAFPLDCVPSGGRCAAAWTGRLPDPLGATPAGGEGIMLATSFCSWTCSSVTAFSPDCATGGAACEPLWTAHLPECCTNPTVHDGKVFVTGDCSGPRCPSVTVIEAFDPQCGTGGAACDPLWRAPESDGGLFHVFVNDLLFVGTRRGGVLAFGTDCRTDGGMCKPAWSFTGASTAVSSPAAAGGRLFVASDDGTLYAFGLSSNG
jgi:outer membrane protein assembly factor BamB